MDEPLILVTGCILHWQTWVNDSTTSWKQASNAITNVNIFIETWKYHCYPPPHKGPGLANIRSRNLPSKQWTCYHVIRPTVCLCLVSAGWSRLPTHWFTKKTTVLTNYSAQAATSQVRHSIKGLKDHATQRIRLPSLGARITSNICPPSVQGKFVVYLSLSTPGCLFCSRLICLASFRIGQSSKFVTNLAKYHSFFARSVSHAMLWIRCHPLVLAAK